MTRDNDAVAESVIEFLDLARIDSPLTPLLLSKQRSKIINKMLKNHKIDRETADYLLT